MLTLQEETANSSPTTTSVPVMFVVKTKASVLDWIKIPQVLFCPVPFAENAKETRHILDRLPRVFPGEGPIRARLKKRDRPIQKRLIDGAPGRRDGNGLPLAVCLFPLITSSIRHLVQSLNARGGSFHLTRTRMPQGTENA